MRRSGRGSTVASSKASSSQQRQIDARGSPPEVLPDGSVAYEIEAITGVRVGRGSAAAGKEYRVKWWGYVGKTWEPAANCVDCEDAIESFCIDLEQGGDGRDTKLPPPSAPAPAAGTRARRPSSGPEPAAVVAAKSSTKRRPRAGSASGGGSSGGAGARRRWQRPEQPAATVSTGGGRPARRARDVTQLHAAAAKQFLEQAGGHRRAPPGGAGSAEAEMVSTVLAMGFDPAAVEAAVQRSRSKSQRKQGVKSVSGLVELVMKEVNPHPALCHGTPALCHGTPPLCHGTPPLHPLPHRSRLRPVPMHPCRVAASPVTGARKVAAVPGARKKRPPAPAMMWRESSGGCGATSARSSGSDATCVRSKRPVDPLG